MGVGSSIFHGECHHYDYLLISGLTSRSQNDIKRSLCAEDKAYIEDLESKILDRKWFPLLTSEELFPKQNEDMMDIKDGLSQHGYYGMSFCKKITIEVKDQADVLEGWEIVIAHRGTNFDESGNILADIAIAEKKNPLILKDALKYVQKLLAQKNDITKVANLDSVKLVDIPIIKVTNVGFSLGGFLAAACVAVCNQISIFNAVTFDAPGIGNHNYATPNLFEKRVINYMVSPNLVNTCNHSIGAKRKLFYRKQAENKAEDEKTEFSITLLELYHSIIHPFSFSESHHDVLSNEYENAKKRRENINVCRKALLSTLKSHNLEKIILEMDEEMRYQNIFSWPSADIEFYYGAQPRWEDPLVDSLTASAGTINIDSFWGVVLPAVATALKVGVALTMTPKMQNIWNITRDAGDGENGAVGIRYRRPAYGNCVIS